jgi:ATP-dependent Clp protease ATP-binding subunit ClpA
VLNKVPKPPWISEEAWEIIQVAKSIALAEESAEGITKEILPKHLFQGYVMKARNSVIAALAGIGLSKEEAEKFIQSIMPEQPLPDPSGEERRLASMTEPIIRYARELAGSTQVNHHHIWISLCSALSELSDLKVWLIEKGLTEEYIHRLSEKARTQTHRSQFRHPTLKESELQILNKFCSRNLTELARQGRLTPAYGVEEIREQIIRCLLRKDRRSIVLTGPAGVGKTKLVEDLAIRIVKGEIPELEGCHVFELDLALFTRGTHLAGSRAERWSQLTDVLRAHPDEIILFIDELHTIVGLPLEGQAMDLANALKPLLVETRVRIIGATTPEEYRRHIEGDLALARRFTEIKVPEPDKDTMLRILKNIAPQYEEFHRVTYSGDALEEIYKLALTYMPNQFFPAKAVDLMDEVAVSVKMKKRNEEQPVILPEDVREILKQKLGVIELEGIFANSDRLIAELIKEKVVGQDHAAEKLADVIITSTFRYGGEERRGPRAVILFLGPPGVGKSYMAQVLSEILFPGRDSLLTLDMTEFGGSSAHAGEHARWRLLGPPPPYVGWEVGGLLTRHALQHPVSVVLIDEFEKADPEARNVLLKIFDEGWTQDGRGRIISFRGIYFILTANAGEKLWQKVDKIGFRPYDENKVITGIFPQEHLKKILLMEGFSPELLSRITHIIMFNPLSEKDLKEIARRKLAWLKDCALTEDFVLLEYDEEELSDWLVKRCGGQPDCRWLTAIFETFIETPLAKWRMNYRYHINTPAILTLKPIEDKVEFSISEISEERVLQKLFEQVDAVFKQRRQRQQAARVLLGTTG